MRLLVSAVLLAAGLMAVGGVSVAVRAASNEGSVLPAKDQARMSSAAKPGRGNDYGGAWEQFAQAAPPPVPGPDLMPPGERMGPPPFEPMGFRGGPFRGHAPTRAACEEDINRHAAMAGYIKSRLNLQGSQKDAWRKIEDAAEPAIEKLRQTCALWPVNPGPPPSLPDALDRTAKQFAARAEFLQAISAPAHALYETLSPDQRAALAPPPPPPGGL